ncbi:hypothetical protein [Hahella ganghwensis]|uniref:hypothetical protein n=1 Tax=Hahella ganghwensis TaxID=286420 RepID=UPI0014612F6A|nr:hypothetical protein [Hahella ganghwensis]
MDKRPVVPSAVPYPTVRWQRCMVQSFGDNVAEELRGESCEAITETASLRAVTALARISHEALTKNG